MPATLQTRRENGFGSPTLSPPRTDTTPARPTTPSTPVQIPTRPKSRGSAHPHKSHRNHGERRIHSMSYRPRDAYSRDAIPPSVAALLAVTSIPPSKASRSLRQTKAEKRMTVESILEKAQESEQEFSLTLSKSPMDILLMAPEDLEADDLSICDSIPESVASMRTVSMESMPSLSNSFATDTFSSLESPQSPFRGRRVQPTRRSLEPVSSPPGESESHPLSSPESEVEGLDFRVFGNEDASDSKTSRLPFEPLKSVFKSNLTASLRALRQAARSFSNLNFSSIPPEDFLTRSILTIDPQVPYTDERRPPPLEAEPTAALRRYLNPTTTARLEKPQAVAPGPALRTFTASIQMQTYKIHRARSVSPTSGRSPYPSVGPSSTTTAQASQPSQSKPAATEHPMPGPRQRETRENPDFIRIAVMEMAMRKSGKLDDQRPGRARWALPPRKPSTKPYEIRPDGVPVRWVAVTH
ncbi:hypothetical protein C8A00DRAFT_44806 [Chaetomidium leptoderma]|uniref:Uncharacterized protein n=1 Tax=Chaetomidium leptoderma TaxID=669021 RepID=A0AAN6VKU5_9PEZI|nr:hypothetical protein C8A00DRAFT_44806 [Chaetomidium leptoderma]